MKTKQCHSRMVPFLCHSRMLLSGPDAGHSLLLGIQTCSFIFIFFSFVGCQTTPKPKPEPTDVAALKTVTQGLTNQPINQEQLKNLATQLKNNPQAQSAIREINGALAAQHAVKYCPENGERFAADMVYCPDGRMKLEWVQ